MPADGRELSSAGWKRKRLPIARQGRTLLVDLHSGWPVPGPAAGTRPHHREDGATSTLKFTPRPRAVSASPRVSNASSCALPHRSWARMIPFSSSSPTSRIKGGGIRLDRGYHPDHRPRRSIPGRGPPRRSTDPTGGHRPTRKRIDSRVATGGRLPASHRPGKKKRVQVGWPDRASGRRPRSWFHHRGRSRRRPLADEALR